MPIFQPSTQSLFDKLFFNDNFVGRSLNDTAIWPMIRSTPTWGFGPTGALEETAIDMLRWEFNPTTLAPLGAAFAGARTNLLLNPRYENGTVGVIGSGGVMPSNVTLSSTVSGVVNEVVAFGTLADGQTFFDMRYSGTPAANGLVRVLHSTPSGTVFAANEVIAATVGYRLIAGSATNFGTYSTRFTGINPSINPSITPPSATVNRTARLQTCTGNTAGANAGLEYMWSVTSGAVIDATIRYTLPQLQRGPFLSSPILAAVGAPGPSTRAQGNVSISIAQLGTRWNRRAGVLICDWNSQPGPFTSAADADWFGLVSWGNATANERLGLLVNPAHTTLEARVTAGGTPGIASTVSITAPAAGVTTKVAVAWDLDAGFLQIASRGVAGSKVALTALPVPGFIMPGRFGTSNPLFGRITQLSNAPIAVFDSALASLT